MKTPLQTCVIGAMVLAFGSVARADARSKAVQEAVEYAAKNLGWKVAKDVMETTARKLEMQAARHGDDMIRAFRQVGIKSFDVAEKHGADGLKLVAKHGDGALVHVLGRPKALVLVAKMGDNAAEALVKHPGISEGVLERLGAPAAKALNAVDGRNGRRLAMMAAEGGDLSKIGRADELLGVVGKHGNRAMEFIWNHKIELTTVAVLSGFLLDPEPFITGARDLSSLVVNSTLKPVAQAVGRGAEQALASAAPEVGRQANWTVVLLTAILAPVVLVGWRAWRRSSRLLPVAA